MILRKTCRPAVLAFGLVLAACDGDSGGPTTPVTSPTTMRVAVGPTIDVTGTWSGRYRETACASSCGPCCTSRFKAGPPERDFKLTLGQEGSLVSGEFQELPVKGAQAYAGAVGGSVEDRRVRLSGSLGWQSQYDPDLSGSADLGQFDGTVDAGERITGSFQLVDRQPDGSVFLRRDCLIVRLERTSP